VCGVTEKDIDCLESSTRPYKKGVDGKVRRLSNKALITYGYK
jgi:hypothetical protein